MKIQPAKHLPLVAGLLLTVNLYLVPSLASSPRATDLAGAVLGLWVVGRLARGRQDPRPLAALGIALLPPLIWLFFSVLGSDLTTGVQAFRWLLAGPWAVALFQLRHDQDLAIQFARGILWGGLVNAAVIVLQWVGMEPLLRLLGLSSAGANFHQYVSNSVRIPGLHGHHNASSSVTSLVIPAGFFLYFKGKCSLRLLLTALVALLVSMHLTSTRGPLLVSIMTVAYASLMARRLARSILIGFIILSTLLPLLAVYGPPGGWSRWRNTEALASNYAERFDSTLGAARLSLENPLGLGVGPGHIQLSERTGIGATHNAFLQAALVFGLPLGLFVIWGFLVVVLRSLGGIDDPYFLPGLMAFHTAGLFMFEEHLNNPTFIIVAVWLMVLTIPRAVRTGKSPACSP